MDLSFEKIFDKTDFPVKIMLRENHETTPGCFFHWHEELEFYYVLDGAIRLLLGGRDQWLYPGDVALVNWCRPHKSIQFLQNTRHYIIQFDLMHPDFFGIPKQEFPCFFHDQSINDCFDRMIACQSEKTTGNDLQIIGEIYKIFGYISDSRQKKPPVENRRDLMTTLSILNFIHTHFTKPITLSEIARQVHMSESMVCKTFKKQTNLTITTYIHHLRFNKAIELLSRGESVAEVSSAVGFSDYNYFSRSFKKEMGRSPSSYKNP